MARPNFSNNPLLASTMQVDPNNLNGLTVIQTPEVIMQNEIESRAQQLLQEYLAQMSAQAAMAANGRIFTRFDVTTDVIKNQITKVTSGLFSSNAGSLSTFYTSSLQTTGSKQYYYEVWNTGSNGEAQFSIAYGNKVGSGSSAAGTLNDSPSRAVYSQHRLLLLDPTDNTFTLANGTSTNSIYVVNFNRARLKDRLDAGNWQMSLAQLSGSFYANSVHTGSNVKVASPGNQVITLIDDSNLSQQVTLTTGGRVYNIVSGSITSGIYSPTTYYGLAYPDMGMLVLDGNVLNASASFNTVTGSNIDGDNSWKLFTSISGAAAIDSTNYSFQARNEQSITSTHYFVRIKNAEYNFSNNPTFVTGSLGDLAQATFVGDPKTYITTIGMYNDRQELLAVAKLSQPVQKSFSSEVLVKVKLDF